MLPMLFLSAIIAAQPQDVPSLDQVLAKHFEAMGGLDKLASVKSTRIYGTTTYTIGAKNLEEVETLEKLNTPELVESKRPTSIYRESAHPAHGKMVFATDGTGGGWFAVPKLGSDILPIAVKPLSDLRILASIGASPFLGYKEMGLKAEYHGLVDDRGRKAHKIALVYPKDGIEITYFLDSKSYLVVKTETRSLIDGKNVSNQRFLDYKKIRGINLPHTVDTFNDDGFRYRFIVEIIEFNPKIDDSRFEPKNFVTGKVN